MNSQPRSKILIAAYACSPFRGSEHGTGWNTSWELAREFDVHVLTRTKNRMEIEKFVGLSGEAGRQLTPHYLELPSLFVWAKLHGCLPLWLYYSLWQFAALAWGRNNLRLIQPELCHHLTFNSFEFPVFWQFFSIPTVLGPLGGGQVTNPRFLPLMRNRRHSEMLRWLRVAISGRNPFVHTGLKAARSVIFANTETRKRLEKWVDCPIHEMVDVGVDCARFTPAELPTVNEKLHLLYVGKFENRKGIWLLPDILDALHRRGADCRITFIGDGPEAENFRLHCVGRFSTGTCTFSGKLPHADTVRNFQEADFVIFPSVRDTSGAVALEALASGCPVVCFRHQGAAWMVDDQSGILIDPTKTVSELADTFAVEILACWSDPARHVAMRRKARIRAETRFSWPAKVAVLSRIYRKCLEAE